MPQKGWRSLKTTDILNRRTCKKTYMTSSSDFNSSIQPGISVILPVYNASATLDRCISGILEQSFCDFELVIVDDGSTDGSAGICRSYADRDSRIRVFSKDNGGVSSARNFGLESARGKYVAFCDSDDIPGKDWLMSLYSASAGTGLTVCGYSIHRQGQVTEKMTTGEPFRSDDMVQILETLFRARLLQFVWNKLFVRSEIETAQLRFDESMKIFEDEYFVLGYISAVQKVVCTPECAYDYFFPEGFYEKYDFSIDAFEKVVDGICSMVAAEGRGCRVGLWETRRVRLPMIVYWYKVALGRYTADHTFSQCRKRLSFARELASAFHDGPFNHLAVRILPPRLLYLWIRGKQR